MKSATHTHDVHCREKWPPSFFRKHGEGIDILNSKLIRAKNETCFSFGYILIFLERVLNEHSQNSTIRSVNRWIDRLLSRTLVFNRDIYSLFWASEKLSDTNHS